MSTQGQPGRWICLQESVRALDMSAQGQSGRWICLHRVSQGVGYVYTGSVRALDMSTQGQSGH